MIKGFIRKITVMEVISRKISELYNDPNNARKHDEKNLKAIKGSLKKFGLQKPIVIDLKDIVIAGNGTLEAARQLGWTEIDCVVTELDNFNATAFAIADNRTSDLSTFDEMILGSTLQALREDGFDLGEIGFDLSALEPPTEENGEGEEAESEPKEKPLTLLISCKDEDEQQMIFLELRDRGFKVKS
jgi:ParB-like chromosome segregation protein Spo0J